MSQSFQQRLRALAASAQDFDLRQCQLGLEKEGLRVTPTGRISEREHPAALGAALTHPWITTDYSEALLELITPPVSEYQQALAFLDDIHRFVYAYLDEELLWAASMPCLVQGEASIPVARYGSSNAGRMKHIYRLGLGYRYGRIMQVISGVHFNLSLPERFWAPYQDLLLVRGDRQRFINDQYFCQVRNILRLGWMIPYLFGTSPAVCKSFFGGIVPPDLDEFNSSSCYEPWGTSLRLGDMGYQNKKEVDSGVKICYDNLDDYTRCLEKALQTPSAEYARIGVRVDGEFRQLSSNILQIENEYYSSVRPKQICDVDERPVHALRSRGIRYVELRSLDINMEDPRGIDEVQVRFLQAWMLYCLLSESPLISAADRAEVDQNLSLTAHRGREPGLILQFRGRGIALRDWGLQVCEEMRGVCELLDTQEGGDSYTQALHQQEGKFRDPESTPSALVLDEMRKRGEGFFDMAMRRAQEVRDHYARRPLSAERMAEFRQRAEASHAAQRVMESMPQPSLEDYIAAYLATDARS